jgi:multidrug efflux system membrane fusion protein
MLTGLLLGAAVFSGCKKEAPPTVQMPPPGVTAAVAENKDVPVYLDQIGKIVSMDMVTIVPQVAGKVTAVHVEDGAEVKKGQPLFDIDPRPFQADLASAEASLAENKANVAWATIDFNRIKGLVETNAVSQNEYDKAKNALDVANAKVEASQAAVETAKLNLEYCKILSPIDGRAGARLVVPGNIVKANEGALMVIQRLDPIYAEFSITENDLGTVRKFLAGHDNDLGIAPEQGLKVHVDVPGDSKTVLTALGGTATANNGPATAPASRPSRFLGARDGTLTFMDNSVQDNSGTIKVRATLDNKDHYFWPGQFVNCRLVLTTKKDAVLIPATAQQIAQQGAFVYVVSADGTAELRPITVGQRQGDMIVVETGVTAGEKVITTGQMMVMPKGKVNVMNAAGPTTAPAVASAK